jgi:stage II sporulation protein D
MLPLLAAGSLPGGLVSLAAPLLALAADRPLQARQRETPVRVLLAEGQRLGVRVLDRPLRLEPVALVLPPGSRLLFSLEAGRLRLDLEGREPSSRLLPTTASHWLTPTPLAPGAGAAAAAAGQDAGLVIPEVAGDFQLQQRRYRGRLQLLVAGGNLQAINHLPLETYLPSVVGGEMPSSWPLPALRAQAVAARTYALRQRKPAEPFDVRATVSSQVYKGVEAETDSTRAAVASTRGQVLMYGGSLANTVFHSSSGGLTENSGDLWRQQLPYLVSVPDDDRHSPVHRWQQRLEPALLRQAFPELGGVSRIDVIATTATGRVRQARVLGPRGSLVLTGAELRSRLKLRSTLVRFEVVAPELAMAGLQPPPPPPAAAEALASDAFIIDSATGPVPRDGGAAPAPAAAAPAPAGSPVDSEPPPAGTVPLQLPQPALLAVGRGFGHGVGMSQWGAHAMAQRGQTHEQILRHYYRGTELSTYSPQP